MSLRINKNYILIPVGILCGLFFGILTGYYFINKINPKPNFLSDIATFEGVIIAIAIPLSLDIVSRISERYKSEVISKQFFKEWEIKLLPYFLILNIVTAILLRFCVGDNPKGLSWRLVAFLILVIFFIVAFIFIFGFSLKLKKYIIEPEFILNRFFNEAEEFFK